MPVVAAIVKTCTHESISNVQHQALTSGGWVSGGWLVVPRPMSSDSCQLEVVAGLELRRNKEHPPRVGRKIYAKLPVLRPAGSSAPSDLSRWKPPNRRSERTKGSREQRQKRYRDGAMTRSVPASPSTPQKSSSLSRCFSRGSSHSPKRMT
jgi:hypothetical protein